MLQESLRALIDRFSLVTMTTKEESADDLSSRISSEQTDRPSLAESFQSWISSCLHAVGSKLLDVELAISGVVCLFSHVLRNKTCLRKRRSLAGALLIALALLV